MRLELRERMIGVGERVGRELERVVTPENVVNVGCCIRSIIGVLEHNPIGVATGVYWRLAWEGGKALSGHLARREGR